MASRIVLLGPPASGKGTQGRHLAEQAQLAYLSTGKQLRLELEGDTELGRRATPYLAAGQFVPDDLALSLALTWLKGIEGGWVLDGFPRTLPQAQALDEALAPHQGELDAVLLVVPYETLELRVSERRECTVCSWTGTRTEAETSAGHCPSCGGALGQRDDDALENFRMRHKAFVEFASPVADYYRSSGRLREVNGVAPPGEVFQRVQASLDLV